MSTYLEKLIGVSFCVNSKLRPFFKIRKASYHTDEFRGLQLRRCWRKVS